MRNHCLDALAYALAVIAKGPCCLNCGVMVLASALAGLAFAILR